MVTGEPEAPFIEGRPPGVRDLEVFAEPANHAPPPERGSVNATNPPATTSVNANK